MCCLKKKEYFDVGIDLSCCYLFNIRLVVGPKLWRDRFFAGPPDKHVSGASFFLYIFRLACWLLGWLAERETFVKTKWWLASSVSLDICFLKKDLWLMCLYLLCTNRWYIYIYTYIVYICFTISIVLYKLSLFFGLSLSFSYDNLLWSGGSVT